MKYSISSMLFLSLAFPALLLSMNSEPGKLVVVAEEKKLTKRKRFAQQNKLSVDTSFKQMNRNSVLEPVDSFQSTGKESPEGSTSALDSHVEISYPRFDVPRVKYVLRRVNEEAQKLFVHSQDELTELNGYRALLGDYFKSVRAKRLTEEVIFDALGSYHRGYEGFRPRSFGQLAWLDFLQRSAELRSRAMLLQGLRERYASAKAEVVKMNFSEKVRQEGVKMLDEICSILEVIRSDIQSECTFKGFLKALSALFVLQYNNNFKTYEELFSAWLAAKPGGYCSTAVERSLSKLEAHAKALDALGDWLLKRFFADLERVRCLFAKEDGQYVYDLINEMHQCPLCACSKLKMHFGFVPPATPLDARNFEEYLANDIAWIESLARFLNTETSSCALRNCKYTGKTQKFEQTLAGFCVFWDAVVGKREEQEQLLLQSPLSKRFGLEEKQVSLK